MGADGQTAWRIKGEEVASCNCAWGCPCQFNALPTTGNCEALVAWEIHDGRFGDTSLDGVRFAFLVHWPGAIHEGNGTRQLIIDESANEEQREAIEALARGEHGGEYLEIFASVCPNDRAPVTASIEFDSDRERREASVRVEGFAEGRVEPIKNPVSGEEHRARIDLPDGFEYQLAEVANTASMQSTADDPLSLSLQNTYAQLNEFDWTNA